MAAALFLGAASGDWLAYLGYLAALLGTLYGVALAARPAFGATERGALWIAIADVTLISLLVAGTGGSDSSFSALYLLAAFGASGRAGTVAPAVVAVGGYLAAGLLQFSLSPALLSPRMLALAGFQSAVIALAFYLAGRLGERLREGREESASRSRSLAAERDYSERLETAISRLGYSLGLLRPADILQWAVETARDTVSGGISYVHAALPEGNLHRTAAAEDLEACPSWWHPEVQRLVLRSSRSGEMLREEGGIPGVETLTAVPIPSEESPAMGALLVGGSAPLGGEAEERVLRRIAREVSRALAGREAAPGGRDPVSGMPNHASLVRVLQREWCYEGRTILLYAKLEGFERYRAVCGFPAAEELLRRVGGRIGGQQRAFHAGPDEFALLVGGPESRARRVALNIREAVKNATSGTAVPLTACVGLAQLGGPEEEGRTPVEAISEARHALEEARRSGEGVASGAESVAASEGEGSPGTVHALLEAAQAHDAYLGEHLRSVSRLARALGRQLGMSEERLDSLTTGALLHDVGKIGLRQSLLQKPGPLDGSEYEEMKLHPEFGVRILEPIEELSHVLPLVKHHHERYDGQGYPAGLAGQEIPLEARITLVADALDSMIRDRAYRKGVSLEAAVQELSTGSSTQFDPEVVEALISLLESGEGRLRLAN